MAKGAGTDDDEKEERAQQPKKKRARAAAAAGHGGGAADAPEEDGRLDKKLRKLLKRQRQGQQMLQRQQQGHHQALAPSLVALARSPPAHPPHKHTIAIPTAATAIAAAPAPTEEELWRRAERARRFAYQAHARQQGRAGGPLVAVSSSGASAGGAKGWRGRGRQEEEEGWGVGGGGRPLVGACRVVEREYTRTVDPAEVRPVAVLEEVGGWVSLVLVGLVCGCLPGAGRRFVNGLTRGGRLYPHSHPTTTGAPPRAGALGSARGIPAGVLPPEVDPAGLAGAACRDALHGQGARVCVCGGGVLS